MLYLFTFEARCLISNSLRRKVGILNANEPSLCKISSTHEDIFLLIAMDLSLTISHFKRIAYKSYQEVAVQLPSLPSREISNAHGCSRWILKRISNFLNLNPGQSFLSEQTNEL
jgi:hypothetical protein